MKRNIIYFIFLLSNFSLAQTETSSTTTTTLIQCAEDEIYIPNHEAGIMGTCQKECKEEEYWDEELKKCKPYSEYQANLEILENKKFHKAPTCQNLNGPEIREEYYQLNKQIAYIKGFELTFNEIKSNDRMNLQKRLTELVKSFKDRRKNIFNNYNQKLKSFKTSYNNLFQAKIDGSDEKSFLGKTVKESELAINRINLTFTLQEELLRIKQGFHRELKDFYYSYYNSFSDIEERVLLGMRSDKKKFVVLGKNKGKDYSTNCKPIFLWSVKSRNCWSYRIEHKENNSFFSLLKNFKFHDFNPNSTEENKYTTVWNEAEKYYGQINENNKKMYLLDYPLRKTSNRDLVNAKHVHRIHKNRGNNYDAGKDFKFVLGDRHQSNSKDLLEFFIELKKDYNSSFDEIRESYKNDSYASNGNVYFLDPELSIKNICYNDNLSADQRNKHCNRIEETKDHIVGRALELFFLKIMRS